jgi:hypothetical protein
MASLRRSAPDASSTGSGVHPRRLRLFAAGCCRLAMNPFTPPGAKLAVRVAELAAERAVPADWLEGVRAVTAEEARGTAVGYFAHLAAAGLHALDPDSWTAANQAARAAADAAVDTDPPGVSTIGSLLRAGGMALLRAERSSQADLIRCVFGNPFRPVAFDPRWRTSDSVGLARAIYEGRAFDRLPILADALTDAGCDDADILAHCRSPGPHVRGCWVIDLILGKT